MHHINHKVAVAAVGISAASLLALTACASSTTPSAPDPEVERPAPDSPYTQDLARSLNQVGFDVFKAATADGGNTAVSPLSIGLAFGMLDAGSTPPLAGALDDLFAYPADGTDRLGAFNALEQLVASDPQSQASASPAPPDDEMPPHATVRVANRMYLDTSFTPGDAYRLTLATYFGAGAEVVPMSTDANASADTINGWVSDRTEGLIPTLVSPDFFSPFTKLVLVNALYMKAAWSTPFNVDATSDEPFTLPDGTTATVPMMHGGDTYGLVYQGDDFVAVNLPYAYDELSMTLIVPKDGKFDAVQDGLGQGMLDAIDAGGTTTLYTVAMPRFTAETSTDLRAAMEGGMGVQGVYDVVGLDGIGPDLALSAAVHAVKVVVDENGTEAAAATALGVFGTSAPTDPPVAIRADRPFLYVIRDTDTGAVLFVGRMLDPR